MKSINKFCKEGNMARENKVVDLTSALYRYEGKWVALSRDEKKVVGSGRTLKEAVRVAGKKNCKDPVYTQVFSFSKGLAPWLL